MKKFSVLYMYGLGDARINTEWIVRPYLYIQIVLCRFIEL